MDPLSITTSIATLLDSILQIYKVVQSIKNGSNERERMLSEMQNLYNLLIGLKGRLDLAQGEEEWMQPIQEFNRENGVFTQLCDTIDQVATKLGAKRYTSNEKTTPIRDKSESLRRRFINGVRWTMNAQEAQELVQQIERLKTTMIGALSQSNLILAVETRQHVSALKKGVEEQRFQDIIAWLTGLNFRTKQSEMQGVPNSGRWFFQRAEFTDWILGRERILLCHGIPGAGKTFLASTTADKVRELHEGQRVAVLVAFCSYDDPDAQQPDLLLASLLKQALQISPKVTPNLEALYDKHRKEQSRPSPDELCSLLQAAVCEFEKTFLVIDGLDEITAPTNRELLLNQLQNLDDVRVMITCRPYDEIIAQFGRSITLAHQCDACEGRLNRVYYFCERCRVDKCPSCYEADPTCCETSSLDKKIACRSVKIAAHPEDVENFILQRIRNARRPSGLERVSKRTALQDEVVSTVKGKAKEMFLLARFYMDSLEAKLNIKQIQTALGHLPEQLDETYDQAIQRVHELNGPFQQMVKDVLMWVAYAKRPLNTAEIEHALAIKPDIQDIDDDDVIDITLLTSSCAGLIRIDEAKYIHPTHETVGDYFTRNREKLFPDGEGVIAARCLTYLQMEAFSDGACSGPTEEVDFKMRCIRYPFLPYASVFWGFHACDGVTAPEEGMTLERRRGKSMPKSDTIMSSSMKFMRSKGNLETAVQAMWRNDPRWDAKQAVQALHLAARFGLHRQAARLLSKWVDVDARDSLGTTPLMYASARGNAEVNEVLLHSNASTSLFCHRGSTALHRASFQGRPKIVQQILEYSDDSINLPSKLRQNRSALMLACVKGRIEVVKRLLAQESIDVNLQSDGKQTALLLAASRGHLDIVKLLLEHGQVDIDHQDCYGYTALSQAAEHGHVPIMQLLMDHGVNPDLRDIYRGTAFLRAVDQGKPLAVRTLMRRGVDYTFRDFRGRTALHGAAVNGRHNILQMLLENENSKLDINVQANAGETPLHDAARCGKTLCVQVLLSLGARTDILDHANKTPESLAMTENQLEVLHVMKEARKMEETQHIKDEQLNKAHNLDHNNFSDVEATSRPVNSEPAEPKDRPFYMAVQFDEVVALEALLPSPGEERESFLDARVPNSGASALHKAVYRDRLDVVEMLLKAGAKPDPTDHYGYSPLHSAARNDRIDIIEILVGHGANLDLSNSVGRTPLDVAVQHDSKEAALLLVDKGAAVREDSPHVRTLVRWTAELGRLAVIRKLVPLGATFMLKGNDGRNAYEIARDEGHAEAAQLLLTATDNFRKDKQRRNTAFKSDPE